MYLLPLVLIIVLVLILPFAVKKVEHNLELFLFFMGLLSLFSSYLFGKIEISSEIFIKALEEPIKITLAVLIAGWIFGKYHERITKFILNVEEKLGERIFAFLLVFILGMTSSIITAIIASLILSEVVSGLKLHRKYEIRLVVLACFSIGLGAVLTPIGEPLSTIATAKLKGPPYHAHFLFLFKHLWFYILPAVFLFSIFASITHGSASRILTLEEKEKETLKDVFIRASKVYVFIMGLIFLGEGFKPAIDEYISKVAPHILYWINTVSAILDNATLTAAEISPAMDIEQIKSILMGLLIAGGILIPGNIPNIICAGKLNIKSSEWAKEGAPVGIMLLLIYFFVLFLI